MRHDEFISKYVGQKLDYDWVYNFQCTDLAKAYADYVLWVKIGSFWGSAWKGYLNDSWTFDANLWVQWELKDWNVAQEGDIIFSPPTSSNPYGHVAVAHDNDEMIEQNWKTGNGSGVGGDAIRLIPFKKDICGYWRLKSYVPTWEKTPYSPIDPHTEKSAIEKAWDTEVWPSKAGFSDYSSTKPVTEWDCRRLIEIRLVRNNLI